MKLAELERFFASAVTSGTGPIAGLAEVFSDSARLSVTERLAIYNRGFYCRQLSALESVFGATKRVLGAAEFERLGLAYLAEHPSDQPAVERVGRLFPEFLARLSATSAEPVVDLAALEWARLCSLLAPNPTTLAQPNAVTPAEFPSCSLKFVPSLSWLEVDSRALLLFANRDPEATPSERLAVAVWRAGHRVSHERLEKAEFHALEAALRGATLSEVCAVFDTDDEHADAQRAYRAVSSWYARKWLQSVVPSGF